MWTKDLFQINSVESIFCTFETCYYKTIIFGEENRKVR